MPRKLRVEYPGAMYHIMSRGDQRDDIFLDDVDRHDFIKTLAEVCQRTGWQVHAYCLMRNHWGGELRLSRYSNGKIDFGWGLGFGVGREATWTWNLNSGEEQGFNLQAEVAGGRGLVGASMLAGISQGGTDLSAGGGFGVGTAGTITVGHTFTVYDPNATPTFTDSTIGQYSGGYVNLTQSVSQLR
jgi:hypothetical protein